MGLLSIFGKISLDTSNWQAGLSSADKDVAKLGRSISNKVKGAVLGAFSVGTVIRFGKKALENASIISRLAEQFNLTTDQVQQLQAEAERTGTTFDALVKDAVVLEDTLARISGGNVLFSPEQIRALSDAHAIFKAFGEDIQAELGNILKEPMLLFRRMVFPLLGSGQPTPETPLTEKQRAGASAIEAKDRRRAAERVRALKEQAALAEVEKTILGLNQQTAGVIEKTRKMQLTDEQKLNELYEERKKLLHDLMFTLTPEATARVQLAIAENAMAIMAGRRAKTDMPVTTTQQSISPLSDSLRAIGNFLGNDPNSGTVRHLSRIERELREIRRNTARQAEGTAFPL